MPYQMRSKPNGRYEIVNTETGQVKGTFKGAGAKGKAQKQLRLLHGIEHGWQPTGQPDTFSRKVNGRRVKLHVKGGQS